MKLKQSKGLLRTIFASQAAREPVEAVYIHIPFCKNICLKTALKLFILIPLSICFSFNKFINQ